VVASDVMLLTGAFSDGDDTDVLVEVVEGVTVAICEGAGLRMRL
jgi:hypothetical protein